MDNDTNFMPLPATSRWRRCAEQAPPKEDTQPAVLAATMSVIVPERVCGRTGMVPAWKAKQMTVQVAAKSATVLQQTINHARLNGSGSPMLMHSPSSAPPARMQAHSKMKEESKLRVC